MKARAAEQKVKKDPALRHISGAVRSIDKAASATQDKATREALAEARSGLAACLALNGAPVEASGRSPRKPKLLGPAPEPAKVLAYLKKNPGSRSEQIAEELGTETGSLRPVLHALRDEGKVKVTGKARATAYAAR